MTEVLRKPDFTIRAIKKGTQSKGEVGVAWKNEDGSIYMKFNPFVTVPVGDEFAITAFPIGPADIQARPAARPPNTKTGYGLSATGHELRR